MLFPKPKSDVAGTNRQCPKYRAGSVKRLAGIDLDRESVGLGLEGNQTGGSGLQSPPGARLEPS